MSTNATPVVKKHGLIHAILEVSIRQRWFVLIVVLGIAAFGA